jgi:hypothetical protein
MGENVSLVTVWIALFISLCGMEPRCHRADLGRGSVSGIRLKCDKENWDTALIEVTFSQDHKLRDIILTPATLG